MADDPEMLTFGCRLNAYESEVMRAQARAAGLGDAVIINSCAVTREAERQCRQAIRRARRERPGARIVVTGCAAQIDPDSFAAMPETDHVLGNDLKTRPEAWRALADPGRMAAKVRVNDIMAVRETAPHLVEGFEGRARAFVQVQNGCDHRCTFCIIPYGRGNSRSVPIGEVARQIETLVAAGYREIVLTGVDITSYGGDLPGRPSLGQMLRRVLARVPDLARLRLSSLDPVEIDSDLWRLIAEEPRLAPHLHLSLQAGDDMILKRMKRRHRRADVIELCDRARALRPDIAFGADIIAGFPTETEAMFDNTRALIARCDLAFCHVFPFSPRPGTPAARMPQLPRATVKARAAALRAAGGRQLAGYLEHRVGMHTSLVMEENGQGRTPHFAMARLVGDDAENTPPSGMLVPVRLTGIEEGRRLIAETRTRREDRAA